MRLPNWILRLAVLGLSVCLLASCGDDDNTTKPGENTPPGIETFTLIEDVDFNSDDPNAVAAERLVSEALDAARTPTMAVSSLLAPTISADWQRSGDCWSWAYSSAACTTTFTVCPIETGYEWTVVLDDTCKGEAYEDWVVLRGDTDTDGVSGTLRFYEANTTVIATSIRWNRAADGKSGTWQIYDGDVSEQNRLALLSWTENAPGSGLISYQVPDDFKWTLTYTEDGDAGSMIFFDLDVGVIKTREITWAADGTGSMTIYDGTGGSTTQSWPQASEPPSLAGPELVDGIDFNSDDPTAKEAEAAASGVLALAKAVTNLSGGPMLGPLADANWEGSEGCWTWARTQMGCQWAYEVCESEGGFNWTVTLDGTCDDEVFDNWVGIRGETDTEGDSGTLRFYLSNTTVVEVTITWSTAADGKSGTWNFYDGDIGAENLEIILTWSETGPGAGQIVWETYQEAKWVLDYLDDGNAGTLQFYTWQEGWVLAIDVTWTADGHGSMTTYDGMGGSTTESW